MEKVKEIDSMVEILMGDQVKNISYGEYEKMLSNLEVRCKVANLMHKQLHLKRHSINEVSQCIHQVDKDLFLKMRDGSYTLQQIQARLIERKTGIKQTTIDDLKE
jgi:hypothetical protein